MRIVPIVEGHGEVEAVRILLQRIGLELLDGIYFEVLKPIRQHRSKLIQERELERAVRLALLKLGDREVHGRDLILVLVDADRDLPCELGPSLLAIGRRGEARDVACVIANVEYETWFIAAAESLHEELDLPAEIPGNPEAHRLGKGWIKQRIKRHKYSEPIDQPRLTAKMDLRLCRTRSPSFDKLCRELEAFISRSMSTS